jgi:hypothetical protein
MELFVRQTGCRKTAWGCLSEKQVAAKIQQLDLIHRSFSPLAKGDGGIEEINKSGVDL